jgi:small conductance mechanosensitive channel
MLQTLFVAVVLFVSPFSYAGAVDAKAGGDSHAKSQAAAAATQPAVAGAAPAAMTAQETESIGQLLGRTRVGQLFEGKKRVTLDDVKNPLFWIDTVKDLVLALLGFIPRVIVAGLFLAFFWLIYRGVRKLVLGSLGSAGVDPSIRDMLGLLLKWAIMGFGVVIACNQIGIQIAALLTGVSIIGLAVGFAAQETLANFIAGIVIFWDKPFKVNDWVDVEGTFGQVQRVTFRATRILTTAGEVVIFPNTHMLSKKVANHTTYPVLRVRVDIGVAYKESIDAARRVLLELVKGDERICAEPQASVGVVECAASSVNLGLFFWIKDPSIQRIIRGEYLEKAKNALDAAGISMPFPHVQVFLEQTPALEMLSPRPQLRAAG